MGLIKLKTKLRYRFTGECGWACGYMQPFGFVPEDGCPVHDPPETVVDVLYRIVAELYEIRLLMEQKDNGERRDD